MTITHLHGLETPPMSENTPTTGSRFRKRLWFALTLTVVSATVSVSALYLERRSSASIRQQFDDARV
jgi:hypothetical protein